MVSRKQNNSYQQQIINDMTYKFYLVPSKKARYLRRPQTQANILNSSAQR